MIEMWALFLRTYYHFSRNTVSTHISVPQKHLLWYFLLWLNWLKRLGHILVPSALPQESHWSVTVCPAGVISVDGRQRCRLVSTSWSWTSRDTRTWQSASQSSSRWACFHPKNTCFSPAGHTWCFSNTYDHRITHTILSDVFRFKTTIIQKALVYLLKCIIRVLPECEPHAAPPGWRASSPHSGVLTADISHETSTPTHLLSASSPIEDEAACVLFLTSLMSRCHGYPPCL